MNTARSVAQGLARSGLPDLVRRIRRASHHQRALVLMYHRVADEPDYLDRCVPPAMFAAQLDLLRQRARVIGLVELVERLRDPTPLAEDIAAITFDDGYRDNLDEALPILQRHGLPATVFVTTGFVDGSVRPLGDRLQNALNQLWQRGTRAEAWHAGVTPLDRQVRVTLARPGSLKALRKLRLQLKHASLREVGRIMSGIEQLVGTPCAKGALMLDWPAVRALAEHGIEIASHTVSHAILSHLPLDSAEHELQASKQQIESQIGRPVVGFAFPNGHREDFTTDHIALLKRLGYTYACTAERGVNRPRSDPFRLRRIGVGRDAQALLDLKLAIGGPVQPCAA